MGGLAEKAVKPGARAMGSSPTLGPEALSSHRQAHPLAEHLRSVVTAGSELRNAVVLEQTSHEL